MVERSGFTPSSHVTRSQTKCQLQGERYIAGNDAATADDIMGLSKHVHLWY